VTPSGSEIMPLVHIVLFEFKPNTEGAVIHDVCQIWIQRGDRGAHWWGTSKSL